jgi:hypothetical protein
MSRPRRAALQIEEQRPCSRVVEQSPICPDVTPPQLSKLEYWFCAILHINSTELLHIVDSIGVFYES